MGIPSRDISAEIPVPHFVSAYSRTYVRLLRLFPCQTPISSQVLLNLVALFAC